MKKLLILCIALASVPFYKAYSISDEMQILNYSRYTLGGHISARADNCFPALRGEFSDNIYPDGDPLGRNVTYYKKFRNSQNAIVPITQWKVATTANTYVTQSANNPILDNPFGTLARWGGIEVEYWNPNGGSYDNGGFALNYDVRMESPGSPNVCLLYPMNYTDANVTVTSFYLDPTAPDDYVVVIVNS
ncbi:hypothetical protein [Chryseobacterium indoltheticum]|uniref:hypothetical protein n=1 Tax=Chryseobacterium indoltheticum TaxID=254 RepID=UPI00191400F5|nr:hypothetical protein [Chryseobacterium indoltheticum]QQQ29879.1 hypothetical protein JJL46_07710 [Chryseobacterium indoltheticum]